MNGDAESFNDQLLTNPVRKFLERKEVSGLLELRSKPAIQEGQLSL